MKPFFNAKLQVFSSLIRLMFMSLLFLILTLSNGLAENSRPKIGLVLSGGGARGFAHIGTLRMIDSLKIPIDYIAGTSMGGIVGALYAIGYDAIEIEKIVTSVDWEDMFTDDAPREMQPYIEKWDDDLYQMEFGMEKFTPTPPSGLIRGQRISLLLSRLTFAFEQITDFDLFPIPYRCVTVDLITGHEVILRSGSLAKAMRSTMSIPSLFFPVEYGDSLLIDGGLLNNLPIDVAKRMGSDVVIAVNVGRPKKTKAELDDLLAILEQSITIPEYLKEEENMKLADLLISPDLAGLSPAVFTSKNVKAIIAEGYRTARAHAADFQKLIDTYDLSKPGPRFETKQEPSRLHSIRIAGNTTLPFQYIYSTLDLNPGDSINHSQFQEHIRTLRAGGKISKVVYQTDLDENEDLHLQIQVRELEMPLIHGIDIQGNESLSFAYIYNLLGIKPGDTFDIDRLENQLTELHSLGYFETVNYRIEPVNKDQVKLWIQLKEKPHKRLNLGFHYNSFHHLVGHLRYLGENTFVPGLRLQTTIDFAGMTRISIKALYPHGSDGLVFYPFVLAEYAKTPVPITDLNRTIALYNDLYYKWSIGFGIWPNKSSEIQIGLDQELVNIYPEIGMYGLPEWEHNLVKIALTFNSDHLDQSLIPSQGWKLTSLFELSSKELRSDMNFTRFEIRLKGYKPYSEQVNLSFQIDFGEVTGADSVNYLWFYSGGPDSFVGIDYFRLGWYRVANFRVDYRYRWNNDLYLKVIYNIAPNFNWTQGEKFYPFKSKAVQGFGLGLLYDSAVGPIELIYARGDNDLEVEQHFHNSSIYLTAGVNF